MKITFFYPLIITSLFAADITIKPSSSYVADRQEVALIQSAFLKQRIQIDDDDALNIIQENRFLADEYIKKNQVPQEVLLNMKLEFEKHLASEVVREMESKIEIEDEVVKSYYIANKEEFYKAPEIELNIYRFQTFDEAYLFYKRFVSQKDGIDEYVNEHNVSNNTEKTEVNRLNKLFQEMILNTKEQPPFLLPPQFFYKHYSVLYIKHIGEADVLEYEFVKEKIAKKLHEKALDRMKKEMLKPYHERKDS